jgi:hypothetical protein
VKAPVIIGGFYRSGTSLLRRIVDAHPDIHCPPEVKFFRDFHGDYVRDALKKLRFFSSASSLGLDSSELLEIFGGAFIQAHERAAAKLHKARWADKNPENCLYLNEWHELLQGRMQYVHVVRNPLDALSSLLETPFPKTVPPGFEERIDLLCLYQRRALDFMGRHPDISCCVRYEDVVSSPQEEIAKLFSFLGEHFHASVLTGFGSVERRRGIEDPKARAQTRINTGSIGRWKKDLSGRQVRMVRAKCAAIMKRSGYASPERAGRASLFRFPWA